MKDDTEKSVPKQEKKKNASASDKAKVKRTFKNFERFRDNNVDFV